ncbi:glycine/D-amino acid oxidase-like deaminating enzyme/nitrite reductase/ring-hydroxylating ferredoxin subunit [Nocardioides luteus]|uniref:FAD-dependent oxidoreductase n=1 Tax=Nocardioides luteus TaxID=1844 RepID=A0ABQ5T2M9_9ACTN|nr:FAD-dependent oxidoreductase [Nocardioides luteus]MDR7311475.1 glycine/D-amino acid oxidase-like deaminating enzyme/nitrite reductase/ring-hydroxylating ferredoxin subunit [Nocardioides luteus]GGR55376.1 FAD-dependent oxidoreductase [Nocardioides luteus]GLJ70125.1 FAD-dependent oxidoreductase [Nocardioides luteus]
MDALWTSRTSDSDPLPDDGRFDDIVVGAGLTGLTAALLLARAGRRVGVVEAREVAAVTTGRTTGKLSLLQGTKLSQILSAQSREVAQAYVDANKEGQQWLLRFCGDHDVPFQVRDAVTYAAAERDLAKVKDEHEAARSLGLDVRWADQLEVPFPLVGGTVLAEQAQFDPMDVVAALVDQLRAHGGTVHEGRRVVGVSRRGAPEVTLDDGHVLRADNVVLATGMPVLDRGLYFSKVEPTRSYIIAFQGAEVPFGMYLSVSSPGVSIRSVPGDADSAPALLVGGAGHVVGRTRSESAKLDELREWTAHYFPGATETHAWSAQDYSPPDGVPFVGKLPRGGGRIYLATGYDKWGMTNGVAAALSIAGQILGKRPEWAETLGSRPLRPRGAARVAAINAGVGVAATGSFARAESKKVSVPAGEGEGNVGRDGVVPIGASQVDGKTCQVVALCTHLGGALRWNDAEKSWDCPLHGSRFAPDGKVLEGPATKPLVQHEVLADD